MAWLILFVYLLIGQVLSRYWERLRFVRFDEVNGPTFWWPLNYFFGKKSSQTLCSHLDRKSYLALLTLIWPVKLMHCLGVVLVVTVGPLLLFTLVIIFDIVISFFCTLVKNLILIKNFLVLGKNTWTKNQPRLSFK